MRSPSSPRRNTVSLNVVSLPVPPTMLGSSSNRSNLTQNMAKSMTIEEMRQLHQRALNEAEAKRTELRLVLASRYRELVGSSDEVIKMNERSQELHDLVNALPGLMEKLKNPTADQQEKQCEDEDDAEEEKKSDLENAQLRRDLSSLPRLIHRLVDKNNVYEATVKLIDLFTLIASKTDAYPLANQLARTKPSELAQQPHQDVQVKAQLKMVYLQMMTMPDKIKRIARSNLLQPASFGIKVSNPNSAAEESAAALFALDLLDGANMPSTNKAVSLLDIYFDSKTKLLVSLLEKLSVANDSDEKTAGCQAVDADFILSKIVLILQYDIILHTHTIFCKRSSTSSDTLIELDTQSIRTKVSKFLAGMLPLVRSKARSVLVNIAGTTAAALGQIRQSLYDKTDGAEITKSSEWEEATSALIDAREVFQADAPSNLDIYNRQFSLWSSLFSTTFSSLVNSLLGTVFGSVHTNVIATLRASLASAPELSCVQPHEAYRNTLKIAINLDKALLKVSEDAHELLVHAEEREESERRLRQSLYVQTCEILGRLLHELRRIAVARSDQESDATKALIIGRLCFLLKFRLTALPKLLDYESSPSALQQTLGMISFIDLQSAFELADDDEDGVIRMAEALEAVESAFSGTQFRGAEMLRETLLLDRVGSNANDTTAPHYAHPNNVDVTLHELTLLTARGLRHDESGPLSALGTVQSALDSLVSVCFANWAQRVGALSSSRFQGEFKEFMHEACTDSEQEWSRLHQSMATEGCVSPYVVSFFLDLASTMNRSICPSDSISPVPNNDYAASLGVNFSRDRTEKLMDIIRRALFQYCVTVAATTFDSIMDTSKTSKPTIESMSSEAAKQLFIDSSFIRSCLADQRDISNEADKQLQKLLTALDKIESHCRQQSNVAAMEAEVAVRNVNEASGAWLASLLGENHTKMVSSSGELDVTLANTTSSPAFRMPLASSVRFNILPVQADRSLAEIQLREKYTKEKEARKPESLGGSVMSSGLGFMSTGLGFFKKS